MGTAFPPRPRLKLCLPVRDRRSLRGAPAEGAIALKPPLPQDRRACRIRGHGQTAGRFTAPTVAAQMHRIGVHCKR